MSSTNFGTILIFASCVVGTCNIRSTTYVGEFFLNGRGPILLFEKNIPGRLYLPQL